MKINVAEIKNGEIKAQEIDLELTDDYIEIQTYNNHKLERNRKAYKKFGKNYDDEKRKRQQKELQEDLLMEIRY